MSSALEAFGILALGSVLRVEDFVSSQSLICF